MSWMAFGREWWSWLGLIVFIALFLCASMLIGVLLRGIAAWVENQIAIKEERDSRNRQKNRG